MGVVNEVEGEVKEDEKAGGVAGASPRVDGELKLNDDEDPAEVKLNAGAVEAGEALTIEGFGFPSLA